MIAREEQREEYILCHGLLKVDVDMSKAEDVKVLWSIGLLIFVKSVNIKWLFLIFLIGTKANHKADVNCKETIGQRLELYFEVILFFKFYFLKYNFFFFRSKKSI